MWAANAPCWLFLDIAMPALIQQRPILSKTKTNGEKLAVEVLGKGVYPILAGTGKDCKSSKIGKPKH